MNANELANELQACFTKADWKYVDICADMLRQQQAEIEALKKAPTKYCPSEDNAAYEKGFIDGMAKQRDSAVQRFVEGSTYKPPIVDLCLRTDKDGNVLPQREIK
jgi:hypothetical protein